MENIKLLNKIRLLHLSSNNLPIGSFTYSQGLEFAVKIKWVYDIDSFKEWQIKQLNYSLKYIDLPILKRLYDTCKNFNIKKYKYWIDVLLSYRDTNEIKKEEMCKGISLYYLIRDSWNLLDHAIWNDWHVLLKQSYLACLGFIGVLWKLPLYDLAISYTYSWIENSTMVALKIIPFGQKTAQKIIKSLYILISRIIKKSFTLNDSNLGASLPLVSIASSLHEIQKLRLFRS